MKKKSIYVAIVFFATFFEGLLIPTTNYPAVQTIHNWYYLIMAVLMFGFVWGLMVICKNILKPCVVLLWAIIGISIFWIPYLITHSNNTNGWIAVIAMIVGTIAAFFIGRYKYKCSS